VDGDSRRRRHVRRDGRNRGHRRRTPGRPRGGDGRIRYGPASRRVAAWRDRGGPALPGCAPAHPASGIL